MGCGGWKGGQSRLSARQRAALRGCFEERFCRSKVEIRNYITAQFDLRYSHSGCVKLLARQGCDYRKPQALPGVVDLAKQAEFIAMYENMLNSLADDEAVYFADAVHPEYQSKPCLLLGEEWHKPHAQNDFRSAASTFTAH